MGGSASEERRQRLEQGSKTAAKELLGEFVKRILAKDGAKKTKLVIGSPRHGDGSSDEFVAKKTWWS